MISKKGQGMSLNVVIIAALALIVLVVLVMVFTGRIGIFQNVVGGEADSDLRVMGSFYGSCKPSSGDEAAFKASYVEAAKVNDEVEQDRMKSEAKSVLQGRVDECKTFTNEGACNSGGCKW